MKYNKLLSSLAMVAMAAMFSCTQQEKEVAQPQITDKLSSDVLGKINQLGFSTQNAKKVEDGYLVEGDILLSEADLNGTPDKKFLRVGSEEQYRTFNLVSSLPRVITVSISTQLPSSYVAALDEALSRYNNEGLSISFRRVSSGANISIVRGSGSYLASAGFPTSTGNPYNQIRVNSSYIGQNPVRSYLATILAHEIGHCIGFRHTDYMDRSYSCGGQTTNEGASTVGAVLIPGTPSGPDPSSWMLACIGTGQNRPFNANDRTALNYLY